MKSIDVNIPGYSYPIFIGVDIVPDFADVFQNKVTCSQIAIISNKHIFKLYGEKIKKSLAKQYQVIEILLPDGETIHNAFFDRGYKP